MSENRVLLIACEMLRDELLLAMERTQVRPEIIWLEKGLHDRPERLRNVLQETIDAASKAYDTILLGVAYCGGALDGIRSGEARLAVPRFDDCIRMLLSTKPGESAADCRSMYFTRQWMISDCYIVREFEEYCRTYGERRGKRIIQAMIRNYRELRLLDSGAFDVPPYEAQLAEDAAALGLKHRVQTGSVRVLEKLLRQQFDDEFFVLPPGEVLTQRQFFAWDKRGI